MRWTLLLPRAIRGGLPVTVLLHNGAAVCSHICGCGLVGVLRAAALMSAIYEKNKDADGFLYITYSGENTFGAEL